MQIGHLEGMESWRFECYPFFGASEKIIGWVLFI